MKILLFLITNNYLKSRKKFNAFSWYKRSNSNKKSSEFEKKIIHTSIYYGLDQFTRLWGHVNRNFEKWIKLFSLAGTTNPRCSGVSNDVPELKSGKRQSLPARRFVPAIFGPKIKNCTNNMTNSMIEDRLYVGLSWCRYGVVLI